MLGPGRSNLFACTLPLKMRSPQYSALNTQDKVIEHPFDMIVHGILICITIMIWLLLSANGHTILHDTLSIVLGSIVREVFIIFEFHGWRLFPARKGITIPSENLSVGFFLHVMFLSLR
tara:strand:- start:336 stop:692 length:357 start_codon:yes stop_codon:yes gene_type:complete